MAAKLSATVHVDDSEGVTHIFGPDDDVPAWAQKAITNPAAWAEAPEAPKRAPAKATAKSADDTEK